MKIHNLKILPIYFEAALTGKKPFEIRKNDRDYQLGDEIILNEWNGQNYTGRKVWGIIQYLTDYQQKEDFIVFAYALTKKEF